MTASQKPSFEFAALMMATLLILVLAVASTTSALPVASSTPDPGDASTAAPASVFTTPVILVISLGSYVFAVIVLLIIKEILVSKGKSTTPLKIMGIVVNLLEAFFSSYVRHEPFRSRKMYRKCLSLLRLLQRAIGKEE